MKTKIHAIAGVIGLLTIATFWTATVTSEILGSHETIASVKQNILWGMLILIPSMAIAGGSGMSLGRGRVGGAVARKQKRMPIIAANGLLVLLPSAVFLALRAGSGTFDTAFYAVQLVELVAGAANLTLMALNIKDGLMMTGRLRRRRS